MIYLDYSATTFVEEEVLKEMEPYFSIIYGNPTAKFYKLATDAYDAVELARKRVSKLIKCDSSEVIFNSGATEGNNTAIKSAYELAAGKCRIITTRIEHSSIIEPCKYLESKGAEIKYLDVNESGLIDLKELETLINKDISLVALAWVNNEIGIIQKIDKISELCFNNNVPLLIDATQTIGKIDIDIRKLKGITFLTFSAHKIGGPKGVGVLYKKKNVDMVPLIHGGGQENSNRAGTSNVPGIVGCGKACELVLLNFVSNNTKLKNMTDKFVDVLKEKFKNSIEINNDLSASIPGIVNVRFIGINNEVLLHSISKQIAASTGSSCSNLKPSHVLTAIGLDSKAVSESIRFSLSWHTTEDDIDNFKKL